MDEKKISLASDNWSSAHPLIIQAVTEANEGCGGAYGSDPWTEEAKELIQSAFKAPCKVFFVPTGTGSNIFAFRLCCRPFESVVCSDISHILNQECGASEALFGCKLLSVAHMNGKVTPEEVMKKLVKERALGMHSTSPRLISLTQSTEVGTVYTLEELKSLSKLCKEENLLLHIDGSRLYNAAVSLGVDLHEIQEAAQADLLSLGGTKNGLMGAEALVIFNPLLYEGSDHLHKQTLQLMSKMRYLSAQFHPFFKEKIWYTLATQANEKAKKIATSLESIPHLIPNYPVETNQIFFSVPSEWLPHIHEQIHCYPWDEEKNEIRFIASWNTSEEDIQNVASIFTHISHTI